MCPVAGVLLIFRDSRLHGLGLRAVPGLSEPRRFSLNLLFGERLASHSSAFLGPSPERVLFCKGRPCHRLPSGLPRRSPFLGVLVSTAVLLRRTRVSALPRAGLGAARGHYAQGGPQACLALGWVSLEMQRSPAESVSQNLETPLSPDPYPLKRAHPADYPMVASVDSGPPASTASGDRTALSLRFLICKMGIHPASPESIR